MNYNTFYEISDPLGNRSYRGSINEYEFANAEISRGEEAISEIVTVHHEMGGAEPMDTVWTTNAHPLIVRETIINDFIAHKITGWKTYEVKVLTKKKALSSNKYYGLIITGRCGFLDYSRGSVIRKTIGISQNEPHVKDIRFDKDFWDGSDLFMCNPDPEGKINMFRFCTEKVYKVLKKTKNLEFQCVPDIVHSFFMLESGASDREKNELETLLNNAKNT